MSESKVLIFGAGYVTEPVVEYLCRDGNISVTLASRTLSKAEALTSRYARATAAEFDIEKNGRAQLEELIEGKNLVISLLPYRHHPQILQVCISAKVHLVTGSYVLPEVQALHQAASDAGITVLCELGLDPGIDHLLACEYFDRARADCRKITGYLSYCGGLPAPDCKDESPLQYKFSWSPDGALRTAKNGAKYIDNGVVKEIAPGSLLEHAAAMTVGDMLLEGYPNRDSSIYGELYNLPDARNLVRGTFRYRGFSECMLALLKIGFLDENSADYLAAGNETISPLECLGHLLGCATSAKNEIFAALEGKLERNGTQVKAIELLGLLESDSQMEKRGSPLLTLANFLNQRLAYKPGQRDMIILNHSITTENGRGESETVDIKLQVYGQPDGYSAMAKTVGYPVAIGAAMLLNGEVRAIGVLRPFSAEIYQPILAALEKEGIRATEICS